MAEEMDEEMRLCIEDCVEDVGEWFRDECRKDCEDLIAARRDAKLLKELLGGSHA